MHRFAQGHIARTKRTDKYGDKDEDNRPENINNINWN